MIATDYQQRDLWENGSAPLVFLLPGATGTKRPQMRGFDAMAATFWLHGFNAYVFSAPGQDGNSGEYCTGNYLASARSCLRALSERCQPPIVILFGSCAGGIIAAHLASELPVNETLLVLWETMFHCTDADLHEIIDRLEETKGLTLAPSIIDIIHLSSVVGRIRCPVLIAFGPQRPVHAGTFRLSDVQLTLQGLSTPHNLVETRLIPNATHSATRGDSPLVLNELLDYAIGFVERHRAQS